MNARQLCVRLSLVHVQVFLEQYAHELPRVAPLRRELDATVKRVDKLGVSQNITVKIRGAPGIVLKQLRSSLRVLHLLPIRRRALVLLRGRPGLNEILRVPHAGDRDAAKLLAAADRIFQIGRENRRSLVRAGLPPDFVKQGTEAARVLAKALPDPFPQLREHAGATPALARELAHGRALVAAIDSEVVARFRGQTNIINQWRMAKRIPKRIGRPPKRGSRKGGVARGPAHAAATT